MNYFTTTQVENKKELNMVPIYTEQEKKLMNDVPTYNFDTIIDYTPDNPNPKILFSTSYNFKEDYRSMFALTRTQVHSLINLLDNALDCLQAKIIDNEILQNSLQLFSDRIINAVNKNIFNEFKIVFEELSGDDKKLKTLNGLTTFVSLRELNKKSSEEFSDVVRLAVSLDKEITLSINSEKHNLDEHGNLKMDSLKKTIERVIKIKFLGGIIGLNISDPAEINKICEVAYKNIIFEFNFDDSDDGVISQSIKKMNKESKDAIEYLDKLLSNVGSPEDMTTMFPTKKILSTPKPIKNMSKEEMDKISKEFMKEYKNKK